MERRRILVIDDEYSFGEFARLLLEDAGYEVLVALDAAEGLRLASSEKPDAVLLDVHLRELSGIEVLRRIKADAASSAMPVLVCSITSSKAEIQEALNGGAAAFLPKPLDAVVLRRELTKALGG